MNDSDIMAYSAVNAGDDAGDDSIFSSGGAIMDALKGSDEKTDDEILNSSTTEAPKKKAVKAKYASGGPTLKKASKAYKAFSYSIG